MSETFKLQFFIIYKKLTSFLSENMIFELNIQWERAIPERAIPDILVKNGTLHHPTSIWGEVVLEQPRGEVGGGGETLVTKK